MIFSSSSYLSLAVNLDAFITSSRLHTPLAYHPVAEELTAVENSVLTSVLLNKVKVIGLPWWTVA